jgi:predicted esterase
MYLVRGIMIFFLLGMLTGCNEGDNLPYCPPDEWCSTPTGVLNTIMSEGKVREFYVLLPADYDPSSEPKPLLFAYHGTGGNYNLWLDGFYDLIDAVGNDAIMVFMQAAEDHNGVNQWNYDFDLQYFEDVLAQLTEDIVFDPKRIFVTGHSSGGGMAHDIGCNYGDIVRAIAPHAAILKSFSCTGSVAVLQSHGSNDTLVPSGTGEAGHQFWVEYNGFDYDMTIPGVHPTCIDHSLGASPYPVQWCLHSEGMGESGHDWASFASEATWEFFSTLPEVEPTSEPPAGGGNGAITSDALVSFTLEYPLGIGKVTEGALSIYAAGSQQPLAGGPDSIINPSFYPGEIEPGSVHDYELPIKYVNETFPGTYAFSVVIYVADGGNPIPFPDKDYIVLRDVELTSRNATVVIDTPLVLEVVFY